MSGTDTDQQMPQPNHAELNIGELPAATAIGHVWHQQGPQLVCTSCTNEHSMPVPTGKMLVGTKPNGEIIYEDVVVKESPR